MKLVTLTNKARQPIVYHIKDEERKTTINHKLFPIRVRVDNAETAQNSNIKILDFSRAFSTRFQFRGPESKNVKSKMADVKTIQSCNFYEFAAKIATY